MKMELDYKKLGLKCGIEVHQQLDTGKLFCRCPSLLKETGGENSRIVRRLRPVASELGEFDAAALEAFKKGNYCEYLAFDDMNADREALETGLKIALMTKASIVNEAIVMRKAVIDGSNTSGFQKTMLLSHGGSIDIGNKEIGLQSLALEEDAARPIEQKGKKIVYSLDRLGIPLLELATDPDMNTPEEIKKGAKKIGELFRRTCKARRGLGSIRQDLNISIKEGARVEIKGVQNLSIIEEAVKREVQRQISLIKIREELSNRKIEKNQLKNNFVEITDVFSKSDSKMIKATIGNGQKSFGVKLSGFDGLLGTEIQKDRRFGTELADNVKAKTGLKGILHKDELPGYGISEKEVEKVKEKLGIEEQDGFALVIGNKEDCITGLEAVVSRCKQAFSGVPEETRNILENGNTAYSRPLPGAARMYPETDIEPEEILKKELKRIKKSLPLTVEEREKLYKTKGLSENLSGKMKLSNQACFFEKLLKKGFNATTSAVLLLETARQIERETGKEIQKTDIEKILLMEKTGKLTKDIFAEVLRKISEGNSVEESLKKAGTGNTSSKEVEKIIEEIVKRNSKTIQEKGDFAVKALMGEAMKELRGKASGEEIMKLISKKIGESKNA